MTIRLIGVPSSVGALYEGTEQAPRLFRESGLVRTLSNKHDLLDLGEIALENHDYRHNHGPVRNWPGPYLMWQEILKRKDIFHPRDFSLVMGGGCSILTGVLKNFYEVFGQRTRLVSIDHHIDMRVPQPKECVGATAFSLYFLTHQNQWVSHLEHFQLSWITAMGFDQEALDNSYPLGEMKLVNKDLLEKDPIGTGQGYLNLLSPEDQVLVHLDLDVIRESDLPSVYMPSPQGLPLEVISQLLTCLLKDERMRGLVVTEFSPRETGHEDAKKVIDLINNSLAPEKENP